MEVLRLAGITPHLIGHAGKGKSAVVYQFAKAQGAEVIEVRLALMADPGDMVGLQEFVRDSKGNAYATRHVLPEWFMKLTKEIEDGAKTGKKYVLFFDELSRGHKDLLQCAFELVYDRALKGTKIMDGVLIVAASNPATDDYAGSMDFNDDAFADRFCHIKFEPTKAEWMEYARGAAGIHNAVTDFLTESGFDKHLDASDQQPFSLDFVKPSRRSWERVSKIVQIIDQNPQYQEVEAELINGIVGEVAAIAFNKFRKTYVKALQADKILNFYTTDKSQQKSVKKALENGNSDLIANMIQDLGQLVGKQEELTPAQADNLGELVHDLTVEHAFATITLLAKEQQRVVSKIPGTESGLFDHPRFTDRAEQITKERAKVKAQAEANAKSMEKTAKKAKSKTSDEIPF